jgi:hypothetical protein
MRHVFRWDLDKTYLRTDFDSLRGLFRAAIEPAREKQAFPGAATLLREIRAFAPVGLFILSGSPRQMRSVLEEKLRLDGVAFDGLVLKPNLENLLRLRFRAVREQVGYKLGELLSARATLGRDLGETLVGDDAESDAFTYSLYADVLAGRIGPEALDRILAAVRVDDRARADVLALATSIERSHAVERILIHLERGSGPARFARFGPRLVCFRNYFQAASVLFADEHVSAQGVARVAAEMIVDHAFAEDHLLEAARELARSGTIPTAALANVARGMVAVASAEPPPPAADALRGLADRIFHLAAAPTPPAPPEREIDYLAAVAASEHRRAR